MLKVPCFREPLTFDAPKISDLSYTIGDPAVDFTIQEFKGPANLLPFCEYNVVYSAKLVSSPFGGGTMSDYLSLDASNKKFTIHSEVNTGLA